MNAWDTGRPWEEFAAWRSDTVIVIEPRLGQLSLFDGDAPP